MQTRLMPNFPKKLIAAPILATARIAASCALLSPLAAADPAPPAEGVIRVATYNVAMYRDEAGQLRKELESGDSEQAEKIAEVLQRVRPHVVLLNEFDYEPGKPRLVTALKEYLEKPQQALRPIDFPYHFYEPVNTGVDSGRDLDKDGKLGGPADCWGYGRYPGQYGMLLLSRLKVQPKVSWTYRDLKWADAIPSPAWPRDPRDGEDFYSEDERLALRLPSKSFWDVAVYPGSRGALRVLCSHPTPPAFDGPEDRNGCRNFDEIGMIAEYLKGRRITMFPSDGESGYHGMNLSEPFVVLGDLNADPVDGNGRPGAIQQLLDHPRVDSSFVPRSEGGASSSAANAELNRDHKGDAAHDTSDFSGDEYGNLRVDYVLPSKGLEVVDGGVYWPVGNEPGAEAVKASDHRLVWLDLRLP